VSEPVACPFCASTDTEAVGQWGGQIITRQCRCRACNSYFEAIRDEFGASDRDHRTASSAPASRPTAPRCN
jgi:hypothetical protein